MKIKLEYPYNEAYRFGYLVTNPENRKNIILYNSCKDRTTVSYSRYLMTIKEKRFLESWEQVDHINEDKTDDRIENLQILSSSENLKKHRHFKGIFGQTMFDFICPICSKEFQLTARQSHKINPTCSKQCGYKKASITFKQRNLGV